MRLLWLIPCLLLVGCFHHAPDPDSHIFTSETCPAKAFFVEGRTKCSIGLDGQKWCNHVRVAETCRPLKADVPK